MHNGWGQYYIDMTVMLQLTVLGTPAEEGGAGKVLLLKAGSFKGVDVAMMAHPSPFNHVASTAFICISR